ncbi:MAG TPA: hypothetical protein VK539_28620 [Myxococcaceae bacterium]|nr:hypothetical protein [Myxococcaceae bacterium]
MLIAITRDVSASLGQCELSFGVAVTPVDVSELRKAEGAVTCCSLVLRSPFPCGIAACSVRLQGDRS